MCMSAMNPNGVYNTNKTKVTGLEAEVHFSLSDKPAIQAAGREGRMSHIMVQKALRNCFLRLARGCEQTPVGVGDMKLLHMKNMNFKRSC